MPTKKKRPRRKAARSSPTRSRASGKRPGAGRAASVRAPGPLQYKVVELASVDERSLERTVNEWVSKGWSLDGVQFAMRESSKRPSMAFVFFTREGAAAEPDVDEARERLVRLSETGSPTAELMEEHARVHTERRHREHYPTSAHERLAQLAGLDEPDAPEVGETFELELPADEGPPLELDLSRERRPVEVELPEVGATLELETLQEGVTFEPASPREGLELEPESEPEEPEEPKQ